MQLPGRHNYVFGQFVSKYTIIQWCLSFALASDVNLHLEQGMQMLMKGQLNEALSHYHQAVESDPKNFLTYFKRSTVFQAMGRYKQALDDLRNSLELNSEFVPARLQKAIVLYRQGALDEAHIDFEAILRKDPHHEEATQYYTQIDTMRDHMVFLEGLITGEDWPMAIEYMNRLVPELFLSYRLRELRAEAYEHVHDYINAVNDYRALTKMRSDNTAAYLKLSRLHYILGEPEESLMAIRECLKLDADHKECHNHYKKVKKLANFYKVASEAAAENNHEKCADKLRSALKIESSEPRIAHLLKSKLCQCLNNGGKAEDAVEVCTETLKLEPNDVYALCDRADSYINLEEFDKAINDYQAAHNIDETMTRAKEGFQRAQKLKKQSSKRDYYKILGVSRSANKKEITKAYRNLASKWHPDLFQGEEKKTAEKKFIDIAAAKEVLTDPEKRKQFDNGEDPLDPESSQGRGFNPFQQFHQGGFNPFGDGGNGYTFKFHFN